jgi:hypothetical protein
MAQDTSQGNPDAGADSNTPVQRTMGSQIRAVPGDQQDIGNLFATHPDKGYVFENDLRFKLADRPREFYLGLQTYLAIGGFDMKWDYSGQTWRLTGGALDAAQETVIRAKFSDPTALSNWADLRTRVWAIFNDGPKVTLVEMPDAETVTVSRGSYANETTRTIHANVRDMTGCTAVASDPTVQAAIGQSFDGFWQIIHETLHIVGSITGPITDKWGSATAPGDIENLLNGLRKAFGLPTRISYYHAPGVKPGMTFDGGDIFWP